MLKKPMVKLMANINSVDLKVVTVWREKYIENDLQSILPLGKAFEHYRKFSLSCACVPLTKKAFSNIFRIILKTEIDRNQIKPLTSSRIAFQGILLNKKEIKPTKVFDNTNPQDLEILENSLY